jgi:DNA polymerase III subunit delta'
MAELVGHENPLAPIKKLAEKDRLPSAMLFVGAEGIGKRMAAKTIAQYYLCEHKGSTLACGTCGKCVRLNAEQSEDAFFLKPDGDSIKIEAVREAIHFLSLKALGRGKFIIIDDADALTAQAANALLKSLEEPPANTYFILISAHPSRLLATIRSRCQVYRFQPLSLSEVHSVLTRHTDLSGTVEEWMLRASEGRCGKILRWMQGGGERLRDKSFAFVRVLLDPSWPASFFSVSEVAENKTEAQDMVGLVLQVLRDAYLFSVGLKEQTIHSDQEERLAEFAKAGPRTLVRVWQKALRLEADLDSPMDLKLSLENLYFESRAALAAPAHALD